MLGVEVIVLGFLLVRLVLRTRREQVPTAKHETAMRLIAEAIRATEGKAWSSELQALLHEQLKDPESARYFQELLQRREQRSHH